MDATHVHLMLTHGPIVGTIIGVIILLIGLFQNNKAVKNIALLLFVAMALISIPVFLTGEGAEETVEHMAGVSESIIHEHEELAEKAIWFIEILGFLALLNIFALAKTHAYTQAITIASLVMSLITFGLFVQVGNLGGQIRHSEIRSATTESPTDVLNPSELEKSPAANAEEEDDD